MARRAPRTPRLTRSGWRMASSPIAGSPSRPSRAGSMHSNGGPRWRPATKRARKSSTADWRICWRSARRPTLPAPSAMMTLRLQRTPERARQAASLSDARGRRSGHDHRCAAGAVFAQRSNRAAIEIGQRCDDLQKPFVARKRREANRAAVGAGSLSRRRGARSAARSG